MKRVGFLFSQIVDRDNLLLAYAKASRGKSGCRDRLAFSRKLEENILDLQHGLMDGSYPVGSYTRFTIYDPKEREICAASFGERVLHHALMNVCEPYFDRWLIDDTYASRKGRGQLKAIRRAQFHARRYAWYLKCDVRKYFDSIPHDGLLALLRRKFKDPLLNAWFERLVRSYEKTPGRGLPIGNLTSQHFANLYLDRLDRMYAPFVRYMDDFVFWHDDKETLKRIRDAVSEMLARDLGLELKPTQINRTSAGMDFLGMRIFPRTVRLNRASRLRYRRKVSWLLRHVGDEVMLQERLTSLTAFVAQADSLAWRQSLMRQSEESEVCGEQPMVTTA